jgi:hypothetical protein
MPRRSVAGALVDASAARCVGVCAYQGSVTLERKAMAPRAR